MGVLIAGRVCASPIQVTVNTSSLSGSIANLAFDLLDGGPPPNSVTISSFASDGTLGSTILLTGEVTGTLPGSVTIGDSGVFNEYLQDTTLGSSLTFTFDTTGNTAAPGSSPDGFSFFLLDPETGASLISPTADPTGNDALFLYAIGEPDPLQIYTDVVQATEVPSGAPEPGALALVMAGLLGLGFVRSARR
ncbi:MAG TPA: NF038129 family PEP-CTERM protein [Casimicrobiaceae bacterium]|nr:NF038129 family PEP-CTERM protein [Casimicrobiaceae bacterium]